MARLLIANDSLEQTGEYNAELSEAMAIWSLRLLWHVEDNDIVVLPIDPGAAYLKYITKLINVRYESLRIIIAPKGDTKHLNTDRLTNTELSKLITEGLAGQRLELIVSLLPDAAVVQLAKMLGAISCVPGAAFASQGGRALVNSKAIFRAIAAGNRVPIPSGFVVNDPQELKMCISDILLKQGVPAIIKKDFGQGCRGNEILSHTSGVAPNGGRRGLVLSDYKAINAYVSENWAWLTDGGRHCVVVEHYFPDSKAIFAEFNLTDDGIKFVGLGEMLAAPIADGQVIPPVGLSPTIVAEIVDRGHQLSAAVHAIGYRGILSTDAIVAPNNIVLFSEYNGRITGSTHIYSTVGARILGSEWMQKRVLLERRGWTAPSFNAAVDMLEGSGLAFNRKTRTGIVLTGTYNPIRKVISYTIIAKDLIAARSLEKQLHYISPRVVESLDIN